MSSEDSHTGMSQAPCRQLVSTQKLPPPLSVSAVNLPGSGRRGFPRMEAALKMGVWRAGRRIRVEGGPQELGQQGVRRGEGQDEGEDAGGEWWQD